MPSKKDLIRHIFPKSEETLTTREKAVIDHLVGGRNISRNTNLEFDKATTFGQRVADRVASFGGSWTFIFLFFGLLMFWIGLNSWAMTRAKAFDPYPYILLNLVLSMLAAVQAPIILMSQNRQADKDRLQAGHDYEVNLKSELEIQLLHQKLDRLLAEHGELRSAVNRLLEVNWRPDE